MKSITKGETENLVNLLIEPIGEFIAEANRLTSLQISERSVCDLEMLAVGAFSPLTTFMNRADYERVIGEMRLADGTVFPIPVTLPTDEGDLLLGKDVALRDSRNNLLAVLSVEEIYEWSHKEFVNNVLGTADLRHPLVTESARWGKYNVSGKLRVVNLPPHYDFQDIRLTPKRTREHLANVENVVAFQTRNPLHRAHEEMTKRAAASVNGVLLLHPVVGMTKTGDIHYLTRVRTYKALAENYYAKDEVLLSLLPLAMRLAGPREALWHAIIRRNYGANYFIVGRDHASPGVDSDGNPFYQPTAAQELAQKFSSEIGIGIIPFNEMVYLPDENRYAETTEVAPTTKTLTLSGTEVREDYLARGIRLPAWFSRPEVSEILAESYPPRKKQGVCLWFTGLSGSGKSTTAEILTVLLMENGRRVTLLDGDVVRTHLSKGLGFSKEDRDVNILRIGFVAAEIVRHGGAAICAAVSPYLATRNEVRNMVGNENFVEIFVDTPLEVCETRDVKGMYSKARRGEIKGFTGIDDPYETPPKPEITIDSVARTGGENARIVLDYLKAKGFV